MGPPNLAQKLVSEMTDRTRESVQSEERTGKMLALGKLSAGLAHELNNPASAALRSSTLLGETLMRRRREMNRDESPSDTTGSHGDHDGDW